MTAPPPPPKSKATKKPGRLAEWVTTQRDDSAAPRPNRKHSQGRNQLGGDSKSKLKMPGWKRFLAKMHLPDASMSKTTETGLSLELNPKNTWSQTFTPWVAKDFGRTPLRTNRSNWRLIKTRPFENEHLRLFSLGFIDKLGRESGSVYGRWTCTPTSYAVSRTDTIYQRWKKFACRHQKTRTRWKAVQAYLLDLAAFDSVFYLDGSWVHNRVLGVLRISSRHLWRRLRCIRNQLASRHKDEIPQEVFRRRILEMLRRTHPSFSKTIGDKSLTPHPLPVVISNSPGVQRAMNYRGSSHILIKRGARIAPSVLPHKGLHRSRKATLVVHPKFGGKPKTIPYSYRTKSYPGNR
jgi:hypothetical protein